MNYSQKYRVKPGDPVHLTDWDPADTWQSDDKEEGRALVVQNARRLAELQYRLYAEGKRSLLIILQAMDAAGKDGTIRHVMGMLNPQGCRVISFKAPNEVELSHDFLWRVHHNVPRRGEIGIFNRSHYEDVLIVRVHDLVAKAVWSRRYRQINEFEAVLAASGTHILKFFLHISPAEQLRRFRDRLEEPDKHWKLSPADFSEHPHWPRYMAAYEEALAKCSTEAAPWFIIPADKKWYRNLAVSEILIETLEGLDLQFPRPQHDIEALRAELDRLEANLQ